MTLQNFMCAYSCPFVLSESRTKSDYALLSVKKSIIRNLFTAEMEPVPATGRSGPVRSRSGFRTGRSAVRPVTTGRPAGLQLDRSQLVDRPVYRSTGRDR